MQIGKLSPFCRNFCQRTQDELIQVLLNAGASEQANGAGQTPQQILDGILEERERQQQQDATWRGKGTEDLRTKRERGRVIAYVDSDRSGYRRRPRN